MEKKKSIDTKDDISYLILYTSFMTNLGLLNGKLGIIIFFYHYSRFTGCKRYNRFADELINELYSEISSQLPIDFANGLSGIAWGITYLIINNFVEADDDVLNEFDEKIMAIDAEKIKDYSLEQGLAGIAYYAMARYCSQPSKIGLDNEYIKKILSALSKSMDKSCMEIYNNFKNGRYEDHVQMEKDLLNFIDSVKPIRHITPASPLSLNGIAGYNLKYIFSKRLYV